MVVGEGLEDATGSRRRESGTADPSSGRGREAPDARTHGKTRTSDSRTAESTRARGNKPTTASEEPKRSSNEIGDAQAGEQHGSTSGARIKSKTCSVGALLEKQPLITRFANDNALGERPNRERRSEAPNARSQDETDTGDPRTAESTRARES